MNYFELFKFSPAFDIDTALLAERYRELQRAVHPDKFANDTDQQKLLSVQRTAQVNDGFQTLKDPIRRAEHMLSLRGIELSHETTTVKDTGFLMQQMEWREALEDGRNEHNETALLALDQEIAAEQQNLFAELSQAFATQQTEQAGQLVRQGRFLNKLRQEIQAALP